MPKKSIFLKLRLKYFSKLNCLGGGVYRALFWLFCSIIQSVFTPKIPKKLIIPQIAHIIQGTLLTFLPKKVIFSSKCTCISSIILTFLPNNPVCFYNKNSQKVNFSSNYANNTVHFIDFSPKKSDLFLKMLLHIKHYFDFFAR